MREIGGSGAQLSQDMQPIQTSQLLLPWGLEQGLGEIEHFARHIEVELTSFAKLPVARFAM